MNNEKCCTSDLKSSHTACASGAVASGITTGLDDVIKSWDALSLRVTLNSRCS